MDIYTYADVREQLAVLLEKASIEGQVKIRDRDGKVFIIRPEHPQKTSPFDVPSLDLTISKTDILDAIRESRTRNR
ncbi:MAG: hypothetical protein OHK0052_14960 [Anaerolineales bacterium]